MSKTTIKPGEGKDASVAAELIYESSHELLGFMFKDHATACKVLAKLYRKKRGHFSHSFVHTAAIDGAVVGAELGYDKATLSKQDLPGTIWLMLSSPVRLWLHLALKVGPAVGKYVPKPSDNSYYINNIAVSSACRGKGVGQQLIEDIKRRAKQAGYTSVELDVTSVNQGAIGFYQKQGFKAVSESGSKELHEQYGLPPLVRMVCPV
jgi:ribosomal protein S18 acetylase RimI-like enzyme